MRWEIFYLAELPCCLDITGSFRFWRQLSQFHSPSIHFNSTYSVNRGDLLKQIRNMNTSKVHSHRETNIVKHSTGDLLSRLKTRKVLGVGETENGDVHRSKISQLLGHNEHLYVKLPRGLWTWQVVMATCITSEGMLLLLCPAQAAKLLFSSYSDAPLTAEATSIISSGRQCHGAAMLGFAFLLWKFLHSRDKAEARASTAAVGLYNFLCAGLILATTVRASGLAGLSETTLIFPMVFRSITAAVSAIFYKWLGASTSGMRKSSSFKDLHSSPIATTEKSATETFKKEL